MKQRITALTGSKKVALLESHHSLVLTSTCDMAELVKPGCDAKKQDIVLSKLVIKKSVVLMQLTFLEL